MDQKKFLNAVNTLKLYRRAELSDEQGKKLVGDLYVDPLPNNHVLATILHPNSTFVIGRKGTGKSTLFQRAQESLNERSDATWAYIDIKTLFESSAAEVQTTAGAVPGALPPDLILSVNTFRNFTRELVREIKKQIDERVTSSLWAKFKSTFSGSRTELFNSLDEFIAELDAPNYADFTASMTVAAGEGRKETLSETVKESADVKISKSPSAGGSLSKTDKHGVEQDQKLTYTSILIRTLRIRDLILRLCNILRRLNIRHLYIFIDDFSELPREDMERVANAILAPFNNWSDEFIKLKVAVYPGRIAFGDIDRTKVDEIYLDIYRAYGRNDVAGMEEKAIDFTRRLIEKRFAHFHGGNLGDYLEIENADFWPTLFYSSVGNPRILGYVLFFAYETNILYGRKIGIRTIQDAARRYYEEKIANNFRLNKFLSESFEERSSIFSLRELLEQVVKRAKDLRSYRESAVMEGISGRPPTSHFHIGMAYESILLTLELNFFVTKYYEMKDRDGRDVSVYCLNYGLCQQQTIAFGRPKGKREYRLYFVERIFDYSPILQSYIRVNQEIVCEGCGAKHDQDQLPALQAFDMLCPRCKKATCRVVNLSRKYEALIQKVSQENLLPDTELGILKTLHDERREMFAADIASELDCSYQLVGKRGRMLAERLLVVRDENDKGRRIFRISSDAEEIYFQDDVEDQMEFNDD